MFIGKLAKLSGVSPKTIRLYEDMGLLPPPKRSGRYRTYQAADADLVRTIKCAQALGFRLKELAGVIPARATRPALVAEQVHALIENKRRALREQIDDATSKDALLEAFQQSLSRNPSLICPHGG